MTMSTTTTTTTTPRSTVVGVFQDPDTARRGISALKETGFAGDAISVLSPDRADTKTMAEETGTHAGGGAATGAVAGGILGGLGGWLVGIGALAIPGVGPFIAAGAFATALGGAAVGAGVGAIAGALVGMGVPEEHAKYYEGEVRQGRTLVTVRADDRYDEAQRILRDAGAYDVENHGGTVSDPARSAAMASELPSRGDQGTMQLREEELHARTDRVQTGQVSLGKEIVSEQRTLEVPLTHEEVVVERHSVDRQPADQPIDTEGRTIKIPVREEQVTVEKQPMVYQEVGLGKREVTETQHVSGTVRREEARIEHEGDVNVQDAER
jgi:uncharacterized protein (TIGR02271 family)